MRESAYRFFHAAMEALHQGIGLRVIGCDALACRTEECHELPQAWDSNCTPWSDMTVTGAPKYTTHTDRKWAAVHSAVLSDIGTATLQQVVLST